MRLAVLTWNLMHGRAVPGAGRQLVDEFATALGGWAWDVALLQEVPPWWPCELASRLGAEERNVLTSRNSLLPLRRVVAVRWPDVIKSNGGGANAVLARSTAIAEHRAMRLSWLPERRWLQAVRLDSGVWVGNLHSQADVGQGERAAGALRFWAGGSPAVLGGDFNVAPLELEGYTLAGGHGVDQVFVAGMQPESTRVLERGNLSDHAPVLVSVIIFTP